MRGIGPAERSHRPVWERFVKFALVGLSGVGVNSASLYFLYQILYLPLPLASALAVEMAIASNYLLNSIWTFNDPSLSLYRFAKFNLVSLGGLVIAVTTLQGLVTTIGLHYLIANLVGIGLATIWNFALNLFWTWGWD